MLKKTTTPTRSYRARMVAQEISENIRYSRAFTMKKLLLKHGYSQSVANSPQRVTQTKAFQEELQKHTLVTLELLNDTMLEMKRKRHTASYLELVKAQSIILDTLIKLHS